MNFLYQIITSAYVYTLYEEDEHVLLHVLDLKNNETSDILESSKIMAILSEDPEVSFKDIIEVDDITSIVVSD